MSNKKPTASQSRDRWITRLWKSPRQTWIRRALFQVHLWSGLAVGLLATVVGLSGSAIVYKDAIDKRVYPALYNVAGSGQKLAADKIIAAAQQLHPGWSIDYLSIGAGRNLTSNEPWILYLSPPAGNRSTSPIYDYFDPHTGELLGETSQTSGLMNWLAELHFRLLGGGRAIVVNGIGGGLLFVLAATGMFLWWPGPKRIQAAMSVQWTARWPRLNWDLHNAFGFWSLLPLAIEGVTGVYYCFFSQAVLVMVIILGGSANDWRQLSDPISSTHIQSEPALLQPLIDEALRMHPDCVLRGISPVLSPSGAWTVQLNPPGAEARGDYVEVSFDQYSAKVLRDVDSREQPLAIRAIFFIRPLHFGTFAGHWSKVLWIAVGLMPGLLFVTGFVMWWRRVPGRWLKKSVAAPRSNVVSQLDRISTHERTPE